MNQGWFSILPVTVTTTAILPRPFVKPLGARGIVIACDITANVAGQGITMRVRWWSAASGADKSYINLTPSTTLAATGVHHRLIYPTSMVFTDTANDAGTVSALPSVFAIDFFLVTSGSITFRADGQWLE